MSWWYYVGRALTALSAEQQMAYVAYSLAEFVRSLRAFFATLKLFFYS